MALSGKGRLGTIDDPSLHFESHAGCLYSQNRDRGNSKLFAPPTPPDMRIRIRRLGGLSEDRTTRGGSQN